jgi:[protein-PII] uridylyltransferase
MLDSTADVALVALGSYGRGELCPGSDIDVLLVHRLKGRRSAEIVRTMTEQLWYPLWDAGFVTGHGARTVKESVALADDDLDALTALLEVRPIAGAADLAAELERKARELARRRSGRVLPVLAAAVELRRQRPGAIAEMLEPDLKEGGGGLRDVQSLDWGGWALGEPGGTAAWIERDLLTPADLIRIEAGRELLLDIRVALQRVTGSHSDRLALQEHDAVAAQLGFDSADALVHDLARAAREIAWIAGDAWSRIGDTLSSSSGSWSAGDASSAGAQVALAQGVWLRGGRVHIDTDPDGSVPALRTLEAACAAAEHAVPFDRASLTRLQATGAPTWDVWQRAGFVRLLRSGADAVPVFEALDHEGVLARLLPEWEHVRSLPQRNAYHRFTVDRHLLETVANAAAISSRVERPDLLVLAALLHDLGKRDAGDHVEVGVELARRLGPRLGFPDPDVDVLAELVENHLLLSEVSIRRDLDDPLTARRAADHISSVAALDLLAALTEADSLATGPAAWGAAKAQLVSLLVERVTHVLEGGESQGIVVSEFPSAEQLERLGAGGNVIEGREGTLTVMTVDRPGIFSKVSGVLALHGLDVLSAAAYSSDRGRALAEFQVVDRVRGAPPWDRVERDLSRTLEGRFALQARVAERARAYAGSGRRAWRPPTATVRFDNEASDTATVIDVYAGDGIGVLYRITHALAELDVDIRSARVQTLGAQVVDAFYVVDRNGAKLDEPETQAEIERSILHHLSA